MRYGNHYFSTVAFVLGLYCGYYLIQSTSIDNNSVQTCFTPGENCTQLIIDTIDQSKENIFVQAYSFTSVPIAQALYRAANRGVKVKILLDKSNKDKTLEAIEVVKNNPLIEIKIDVLPGIAHNKIMIIDDITITGSFNFTNAAQNRNAENVLKIKNDSIKDRFLNNWQKRHAKSHTIISLPSSGHTPIIQSVKQKQIIKSKRKIGAMKQNSVLFS